MGPPSCAHKKRAIRRALLATGSDARLLHIILSCDLTFCSGIAFT